LKSIADRIKHWQDPTSIFNEIIANIRNLVRFNRRLTIMEMADELNLFLFNSVNFN